MQSIEVMNNSFQDYDPRRVEHYQRALETARKRWPAIAEAAEHPWVEAAVCGRAHAEYLPWWLLPVLTVIFIIKAPLSLHISAVLLLVVSLLSFGLRRFAKRESSLFGDTVDAVVESMSALKGKVPITSTWCYCDIHLASLDFRTLAAERAISLLVQFPRRRVIFIIIMSGVALIWTVFLIYGSGVDGLAFLPAIAVLAGGFSFASHSIILSAATQSLGKAIRKSYQPGSFQAVPMCIATYVLGILACFFAIGASLFFFGVGVTLQAFMFIYGVLLFIAGGDRVSSRTLEKKLARGDTIMHDLHASASDERRSP